MPRYIRARVPGGSYFFTVTLLDRQCDLLVTHIDGLRAAFRRVRTLRPFEIDAVVVLPDHLHCIWTLPPDDADYSSRWLAIKSLFARQMAQGESLSEHRRRKGERGIWQRRFWEHTIRDERDLRQHVDYIHFNPVKHGHASRVRDWPHSSFHRFVRQGWYPVDWAGDIDDSSGGISSRHP